MNTTIRKPSGGNTSVSKGETVGIVYPIKEISRPGKDRSDPFVLWTYQIVGPAIDSSPHSGDYYENEEDAIKRCKFIVDQVG